MYKYCAKKKRKKKKVNPASQNGGNEKKKFKKNCPITSLRRWTRVTRKFIPAI